MKSAPHQLSPTLLRMRLRLTCFSESLIVKPRLANLEGMPVISVEFLVDVHHIKVLVLSQRVSRLLGLATAVPRTIQS